MKLSYEFLITNGHSVEPSKRTNGGIVDDYVYDIWNTTSGEIWFKIPFYKGI